MDYKINREEVKPPPVKSITLELTVEEFYIIGRAVYSSNLDETVQPHSRLVGIRIEAGLPNDWKYRK